MTAEVVISSAAREGPTAVLAAVRKMIDVLHHVNPVNVVEARACFFDSGEDPVLRYREFPKELGDWIEVLESLNFSDIPGGALYELARRAAVSDLKFIGAVGTDEFTELSQNRYAPPTLHEREAALYELGFGALDPVKPELDARIVYEAMVNELKTIGLEGWTVECVSGSARCRVHPDSRRILLNPESTFYEGDDKKLIVHELYGHALRAANGLAQPLAVLGSPLPDYLATEEGITTQLEQLWSVRTSNRAAAKYMLAVDSASHGGFRDVFETVRPHCPNDDEAFKLVLRAKRGISDTERPGGYSKDVVYFRGFLKVDRYLEAGGSLEKLYVGKIALEHLPLIELLRAKGLVQPPRWLPPLP